MSEICLGDCSGCIFAETAAGRIEADRQQAEAALVNWYDPAQRQEYVALYGREFADNLPPQSTEYQKQMFAELYADIRMARIREPINARHTRSIERGVLFSTLLKTCRGLRFLKDVDRDGRTVEFVQCRSWDTMSLMLDISDGAS